MLQPFRSTVRVVAAAAADGVPVARAAPLRRRPAAVELRRSDLGYDGPVQQSVSVEELDAPELAVGLPADARVALTFRVTPVGLSYYVNALARCEQPHVHACARCGREVESENAEASFEVLLEADLRRKKGSVGAEESSSDENIIQFPPHANAVDLTQAVRDALLLALPACPSCPDCAAAAAAGQTVVAQYTSGPVEKPLSGLAALQKLRRKG